MMQSYALIDSGDQKKLERFGEYLIVRPAAHALWRPVGEPSLWENADAVFSRDEGVGWVLKKKLPSQWKIGIEGLYFNIAPTAFGHLGIFPEHSLLWQEMRMLIEQHSAAHAALPSILNLFAYSGGATLAAASVGARVCHLDASQGMVSWARENARLNGLQDAPVRWIIDDVFKFLRREVKRGVRYDGILLDPPSFGRGNKGEVFKFERDIHPLLELCLQLLSSHPLFLFLTTHTPGMTPVVMQHLLQQKMERLGGEVLAMELSIPSQESVSLPCGSVAKWINR